MKQRIVLHIDRLVLNGFQQEDRQRIAEGLQGELGRLLGGSATAGRLASLRYLPRVRVGGVGLAQGATPEQIGGAVASGIFRRLKL